MENEHAESVLTLAHKAPPCSEEYERVLLDMFENAAKNVNPETPMTLRAMAYLGKLARPEPGNSQTVRNAVIYLAGKIAQKKPEYKVSVMALFSTLRNDPVIGEYVTREIKELERLPVEEKPSWSPTLK